MARVLVVDDEPGVRESLRMLLRSECEVATADSVEAALREIANSPPDLILLDLVMPGRPGIELLREIETRDAPPPVVILSATRTVATAVEAMKSGAADYVTKPFEVEALRIKVRQLLSRRELEREVEQLRARVEEQESLGGLLGRSVRMREVFRTIRRVASAKATILIRGASGTGKELVARAVHYHSDRVGAPLVAANCKAFAEGVFESELFGHEKGAFTGADRTRIGLFERAHGGTLLLDEIAEIGPDLQAKLLRVLQERRLTRVGASEEREVDVRVVAATNRNLRAEVAEGRFREDLYFRLAVIPIHIPPLRERRDDILPLARHFLQRLCDQLERDVREWSDEVEAALVAHSWPGNVRELENTIERGVVLARGQRLEVDDLLIEPDPSGTEAVASLPDGEGLQDFLDREAAERIRAVLRDSDGVRVEAARRLGVDRTTLYRLMRKFGIAGDE
jgi:DNA-binding NtrC family response regulator